MRTSIMTESTWTLLGCEGGARWTAVDPWEVDFCTRHACDFSGCGCGSTPQVFGTTQDRAAASDWFRKPAPRPVHLVADTVEDRSLIAACGVNVSEAAASYPVGATTASTSREGVTCAGCLAVLDAKRLAVEADQLTARLLHRAWAEWDDATHARFERLIQRSRRRHERRCDAAA